MNEVRAPDRTQPAPLYASRQQVYPKAVHGPVRRAKWIILGLCLALYYLVPLLRWDRGPDMPNQAVLVDLANGRLFFFFIEIWPQEIYYLTGLLMLAAIGLFAATSLFGRVWCGFACPQTVWTDLFMWVERRIQGDRNTRMRRDAGAMSFDKAWRKAATHVIWLAIAFWTGGAWTMYYVDAPTAVSEFWHGTAGRELYGAILLLTFTTYLLAGWAREQVCTYMCPWPRFQSAMLDEESIVVTYQGWRGEPRGHGKRDHTTAALGACVDCSACMHVCPTGIDIRNGIQLQCINCGLCIDACNEVMARAGQPKWLITWDSQVRQKAKAEGRGERFRFLRPRTMIYVGALLAALTTMGVSLALRPHVELSVLHDRAPLFVAMRDGTLRNAYTVKIANKTMRDTRFVLELDGLRGAVLTESEAEEGGVRLVLPVDADSIGTFRVLVVARPDHLVKGAQDVRFTVRSLATEETALTPSVFMGPGAGQP